VRNTIVRFDHVTGGHDRERRGPAAAIVAALFSALALFAIPMPSHATEEPEYQIVRKLDGIEVREYAANTVAEVIVAGPAGRSRETGDDGTRYADRRAWRLSGAIRVAQRRDPDLRTRAPGRTDQVARGAA